MVALRSDRQDRTLVVVLWVLTLMVFGVGVALVKPVLIFWGALGVAGSVFLTRIHVRDTRTGAAAAGTGAGADVGVPAAGEPEGDVDAEAEVEVEAERKSTQ